MSPYLPTAPASAFTQADLRVSTRLSDPLELVYNDLRRSPPSVAPPPAGVAGFFPAILATARLHGLSRQSQGPILKRGSLVRGETATVGGVMPDPLHIHGR